MAINQHLQGTLEWLQQTSSAASTPVYQHNMPRKEPPSVALGTPPSIEGTEDPLGQKETDSAIPVPQVATPGDTTSLTHAVPQLLQLNLPQTPEMVSIFFISQHQTPPRVGPARLTDELLQLQERMNVTLEQLLTTWATMDSHHKELELNTELAACLNKVQAIEAIKEAEVCHTTATCILQQTHWENVLMLEHEARVEEGQDC